MFMGVYANWEAAFGGYLDKMGIKEAEESTIALTGI